MVDASRCTVERRSSLLDQALGRARRAARPVASALAGLVTLALASACGNDKTEQTPPTFKTREELLNPETCRECHSTHYSEWVGSMHAYAAKDPVFVAMNRRGQRETNGALGSFCVNCHAPLAVREAERAGTVVDDWSNFNELPYADQGVGCYFCHNISSVEGTHNAQLSLANDVTMRGRISDPVANSAHASEASPYLSGADAKSADACGACHDIVLPSPPAPPPTDGPVQLERTYQEWLSSMFAPANAVVPSAMLTCAACHMPYGSKEVIADVPGLRLSARERHAHTFPAVDLAFPSAPSTSDPIESQRLRDEQERSVRELLDNTLSLEICVESILNAGAVQVTIDNSNAGHNWPSGASQDRRAWVEVTAYRNGQVVYTNAVEGDREPAADVAGAWIFRDRMLNGDREVHMFWEATDTATGTIGPHKKLTPSDPTSYNSSIAFRRFPSVNGYFPMLPGDNSSVPDRVTVRIRMRAMGHEVLDDLVKTGDLDPKFLNEIPTFDLLPNRKLNDIMPSLETVSLEWSEAAKAAARATNAFKVSPLGETRNGRPVDCISML